ncbi:mannose-1-phosphate guanylyltransferase/mannose-6-phosphate isomerase, partial [Hydrocarboniphaga effusa]
MIVPVLMAGGSGTRLWPLSREQYPKQFLKLLNERSLLQNTALRVARLEDSAPPLVIGGDAHRFVIAEQMREIGFDQATVMLEPEGRNTAPAAAVAAHYASTHFGPQALVFLLAADQAVENTPAFVAAVEAAAKVAATGKIVTFGIQPTHPETGFGYIKAGPAAEHGAFEVAAFVEKPVLEKAQAFLDEGGYYWNGGMFLFRADVFLDELKRLEPEMHAASLQSWNHAVKDIDFVRLEPTAFKRCRNESIDYAVMEKTANIALVPLDAGWDDVGSWTYLGKLPATDDAGNRVRGDVIVEDSQDNLVHASTRLVSLVGMKDTVVVETEDAVLVAPRERVQEVKKIVQKLKKAKRTEAETSPRVYRPWGSYETVA